MNHGNRYREALKLIEHNNQYDPEEAIKLVKATGKRVRRTVELPSLGVDPITPTSRSEHVVLPHGTGKTMRVLVLPG